jgi:hypothetical protein
MGMCRRRRQQWLVRGKYRGYPDLSSRHMPLRVPVALMLWLFNENKKDVALRSKDHWMCLRRITTRMLTYGASGHHQHPAFWCEFVLAKYICLQMNHLDWIKKWSYNMRRHVPTLASLTGCGSVACCSIDKVDWYMRIKYVRRSWQVDKSWQLECVSNNELYASISRIGFMLVSKDEPLQTGCRPLVSGFPFCLGLEFVY